MTYHEQIDGLTRGMERIVLQLWAQVERGDLTRDDFKTVLVQLLAVANARGYAMGELSIAAFTAMILNDPTPPLGAQIPAKEQDRLAKAVATTLALDGDTRMRLVRLVMNEPMNAAARGAEDAMNRDKRVTGWKRGLEPDACELCVWWWREDRVWHPTHPMPRHTGCMCNPVPVVNEKTDNYQSAKQAHDRARERQR